ncbi:MAG: NADH dehydrogenase (quinone) subunit D [Acidithiobacillus sp.]
MLLAEVLQKRFQATPLTDGRDGWPDFQVAEHHLVDALHFLHDDMAPRFSMLLDLTAVDERGGQAVSERAFTLIYHLHGLNDCGALRLRVPHVDADAPVPTVTGVFANANWYEREVYDLFGLTFSGHPDLRRILLPPLWEGHPLRKAEPIRATERPAYRLSKPELQEALKAYSDAVPTPAPGLTVLNVGPHHPGTHGILRFVLKLSGEEIATVDPDIGYHHRGVEKIAEGHTFHNFIPYTDRVDYLGGVLGEFPYVRAIEMLADLTVPPRAEGIRTLLAEICRISSHLVWLGSYGNDLGTMGPAFYAFRDRALLMDLIEKYTGGRLHPQFFRIGGVAMDLPEGWREDLLTILRAVERGLRDSEHLTVGNPIFQARTRDIGVLSAAQAEKWAVSGILLRSTGKAWDMRKAAPYGLYGDLDFAVPTSTDGDALARTQLHIEEIRESIGMLRQLAEKMPEGPTLAADARYAFPPKDHTLRDIETLIHHFEQVAGEIGPPAGQVLSITESARGMLAYYVVADGGARPYRLRVRTPSFPHVQLITELGRGTALPDFIATIGSIDYVLADLDR